jgi:large subunit ribosomal protein L54
MKNQQDPVAMEDDEYPAWLWSALAESKEKSATDDLEGDLFGILILVAIALRLY